MWASTGNHYVFKGDNNSWTDPERPTRADLVGKLWLEVPHGGSALDDVHRYWMFVLAGALLLFFGTSGLVIGRRRRRRRNALRASSSSEPAPTRAHPEYAPQAGAGAEDARRERARPAPVASVARRADGSKRLRRLGALQYGAGIVLAVCLVVGVFAWSHRPTDYGGRPSRLPMRAGSRTPHP